MTNMKPESGRPRPASYWDDDAEPPHGKRQAGGGDLAEWAFDELEAQDWIDAEQEAQGMLGIAGDCGEDPGR